MRSSREEAYAPRREMQPPRLQLELGGERGTGQDGTPPVRVAAFAHVCRRGPDHPLFLSAFWGKEKHLRTRAKELVYHSYLRTAAKRY